MSEPPTLDEAINAALDPGIVRRLKPGEMRPADLARLLEQAAEQD